MEPFPFLALRLAQLPKHFTSNRRQFCDEILTDFAALVQLEGVVGHRGKIIKRGPARERLGGVRSLPSSFSLFTIVHENSAVYEAG